MNFKIADSPIDLVNAGAGCDCYCIVALAGSVPLYMQYRIVTQIYILLKDDASAYS